MFGRNEMLVPNPSILSLALDEVLSPMYIFQVFSITIWLLQLYW
jgi:cation-transporting ATPase 13A3/4/5